VECKERFCNVEIDAASPFHQTIVDRDFAGSLEAQVLGATISIKDRYVSVYGLVDASGQGYSESDSRVPGRIPQQAQAGMAKNGEMRSGDECGSGVWTAGAGGGYGGRGGMPEEPPYPDCGSLTVHGNSYGSVVLPWDFGGAGSNSSYGIGYNEGQGGAGGGRIEIQGAVFAEIEGGSVIADGAEGTYTSGGSICGGGGAGGSIQIHSAQIIGSGNVFARGASDTARAATCGAGAGGRIAMYGTESISEDLVVSAQGGRSGSAVAHAAAGTIFENRAGVTHLNISNHNAVITSTYGNTTTPWPQESIPGNLDWIHIKNAATLEAPDARVPIGNAPAGSED